MDIQADISQLRQDAQVLSPQCKIKQVGDLFLAPHCQAFLSLPVIENGVPLGIVSRYQIMNIYVMPYGRDLYGNRPVSSIMNTNPLVLEATTQLELASEYISENMRFPIMEDFIIVADGMYQGVGMVMDVLKAITDLKFRAYDRALKEKVEQLKQRNSQLALKSEEAKAANKAKSQFLATMSHELRTPLNAILGYNEMVQEDLQDLGIEECQADLQKAHQAATHLLSIINDVLDISKIEAGKMALELAQFDIMTLLESLQSMVAPHMDANHNQLRIDAQTELGDMYADRQKLTQVLLNLLSNAAKFSARSEVLLKVMPFIENNEPWLVFSVQDHGIGLQPAQLDKLFQPFTQADTSYTRKYGGTGLGLSISKQMTKLMGGHVDVVSQPGQGSTFSVYLPRHVNAPDKAGKKKKVHFSPSDMLTTRENQPLN